MKKKVTYRLTSENIERVPNEMMSFAKSYLPTVKLQVVDKFRETTPTEGNLFTDEKYEVKQVVTPNDVARQFNADFRKTYNSVKNKFGDFIERYNLTKKPFEQQVKMAYAFIKTNRDYNDRSKYNNYAIGGLYRMNWKPQRSNKESYFLKYTAAANMGKDFEFAAAMSRCLDMLQIPHEVLAVMPRDIGKLSDLLLGAEVTWVVRAKNKSKNNEVRYLFPMNAYTTTDENYNPYLYGAPAYAFTPSTDKKDTKEALGTVTKVTAADPATQVYHAQLTASFDESLEKLSMSRTVARTGSFKTEITPIAIVGIDFDAIYEQRYTTDTPEEVKKNLEKEKKMKKSKRDIEEEKELEIARIEILEKQKIYMKKELESDYDDIDSYDSYQTIAPGITEDSSTLIYKEQFKLNNMIAKAGRNYTIEIGKMLSKEPKLDDDDRKPRQADIEIWFPRTLINEVELTLPSGYAIEDLKALNFVVDNDLMHFEVVSTLAADKLSVKTTKIYKVTSAPKTEFPKIVDVFEKAYDFSQQKIVLKKM